MPIFKRLITAQNFVVGNFLKNCTQVNNNKFCLMIDNVGLMLIVHQMYPCIVFSLYLVICNVMHICKCISFFFFFFFHEFYLSWVKYSLANGHFSLLPSDIILYKTY